MKSIQNFYVYNFMEGKTLIQSKFDTLSECLGVLIEKEDSIPLESYFSIGVDYISDKGFELSKDFISFDQGEVNLVEVIDGTNINEIPQIINPLRECVYNFQS